MAMQLTIPSDLEALVRRRLASGAFRDVEDVLRHALEAQDAEQSWTPEERDALLAHIDEGFREAEQGRLIEGSAARRQIQNQKAEWGLER